MGIFVSKQLEEQAKKQQQFMLESQRIQLERQLQMQQITQERAMAMQVARSRDIANLFGLFTGGLSVLLAAAVFKYKQPALGLPVLPFCFVTKYFYGMGYGNRLQDYRTYAETLLATKPELVALPGGPITFEDIEQRRNQQKDEERFKPNQLYF